MVGSIGLARARSFATVGVLPDLRVRVCDPVVMLFFATGRISHDGWALCRQAGVAAMDGEMIAAFMADKAVGVSGTGKDRKFDKSALEKWLFT